MPSFIRHILEELGWNDSGTGGMIPVSSEENKQLERLLEERNKELHQLKSDTEAITIKQNELEQHKNNLFTEHRENMHLLFIHNEQKNNEEHLLKVTSTEGGRLKKEVEEADKTCRELQERGEKLQVEIMRLDNRLKKRGKELGDDNDAINDWRTLLKRGEEDIGVIEKFSKGDAHQIEVIDDKRRRLKLEHDRKQEALAELCANLLSEERAAERIALQVSDLLTQRRHIVSTWTDAVRHLRQRDKDITRMKVELELQCAYARQKDENLKEKIDFLDEQYRNNSEADREVEQLKSHLSNQRQWYLELSDTVKTLHSELLCLKRQVTSTATQLSNCRMDNKRLFKEKTAKEHIIHTFREQIDDLKMKLKDLKDTTKTSEQRMKQLQDMLKNEERYEKTVILENERLQKCVAKSQQTLVEFLEKDNYLKLLLKGFTLSISQAEVKQVKQLKELTSHQDILFKVSYNLIDVTKRTERMEGSKVDPEEEHQLEERRIVLEAARNERYGAVKEVNNQLISLGLDERRLYKLVAAEREYHIALANRVLQLSSTADGATREYVRQKKECRCMRAEEAALALRTQHADRAVRQLEDRAFGLEKAVVTLKAAVQERCAEAGEQMQVLNVQRRSLLEEKNLLTGDINFERMQVNQLKSKYEIYLATLGKDENGEPLSLTYFKLKNAQEKNELQQQGDSLDVAIRKSEMEIAALEATLHVLDTANRNFARSLGPAQDEDPEMLELKILGDEITVLREERKKLVVQCRSKEQIVEGLRSNKEALELQVETLNTLRFSLEDDVSSLKEALKDQREKVHRAEGQCNIFRVKARRRLKDTNLMEGYRADVDCRMVGEANRNAVAQLRSVEGLDVDEQASKWGINLGTVQSGGHLSKRFTLSNASEQGSSLRLHSSCSSKASESSGSQNITSQLLAVRTVRSPLSPSPKESVVLSPGSQQNIAGCSMSIGIVNLDLDLEPVRESSTLGIMSRSVIKKQQSKDASKSSTSKKGQSFGVPSTKECR